MLPPLRTDAAIQTIIREERGRILAHLTQRIGDVQLAEDSLQDAIEIALKKWPGTGVPESPAGWLTTTARNKAIDRLRRDRNFKAKQKEIAYLQEPVTSEGVSDISLIPDKRLEMIFTCCHPALPGKSRIALTLRTLGGLTTEEIAAAFLDRPATMAQRLVRAKSKIRLAGIPYQIPDREQFPERLSGVLSVIYLIFNEGYAASSGQDRQRTYLIDEAIRLGRIMYGLLPDQTEVAGLLALMLLHDSRRFARTDAAGRMVPLEHQDRALWQSHKISEGQNILKMAMAKQRIGPYQLQAAISALHVEAPSWEATDWPQILALYNLLYRINPSPVIRLNQAVATSYVKSPEAGLEVLASIPDDELKTYQPFFATRADLLRRAGETDQARQAFEHAIALSDNDSEIRFLETRIASL